MTSSGSVLLTIGQLAAYAGVTVKAIRHYHERGLLAEPVRDASGYRRYGAEAVVDVIRIRTLAQAGVPLARVADLLAADRQTFETALSAVAADLDDEIDRLRRHRRAVEALGSPEDLALPASVTTYLRRLRTLGYTDANLAIERDVWILIAAQRPQRIEEWMAVKHASLDDADFVAFLRSFDDVESWDEDDPRFEEAADRLVVLLEREEAVCGEGEAETFGDDALVAVIDAYILDRSPFLRRVAQALERRGWGGWTELRRIEPRDRRAAGRL